MANRLGRPWEATSRLAQESYPLLSEPRKGCNKRYFPLLVSNCRHRRTDSFVFMVTARGAPQLLDNASIEHQRIDSSAEKHRHSVQGVAHNRAPAPGFEAPRRMASQGAVRRNNYVVIRPKVPLMEVQRALRASLSNPNTVHLLCLDAQGDDGTASGPMATRSQVILGHLALHPARGATPPT